MYRLSKDQYNMLLNNSITSAYKKSITTSRKWEKYFKHQWEKHFKSQGSATTHGY